MAFENEGAGRDEGGFRVVGEDGTDDVVAEVVADKGVDGFVYGREVVGEEAGLFLEFGEERAAEVEERVVFFVADDVVAAGGELEVDEFTEAEFLVGGGEGGGSGGGVEAD